MAKLKPPITAPGLALGNYPEKPAIQVGLVDKIHDLIQLPLVYFCSLRPSHYQIFIDTLNDLSTQYSDLSQVQLYQQLHQLRANFSMHGLTEDLITESFALVKVACHLHLGITPYDTQLLAARMMLDGHLAEMATGEGKTLATAIGASVAALAGSPVHVITANDYLVSRDAEQLLPLYQALGLSVGTITQTHDTSARMQAYERNITYVTAKELVFDYLRDKTIAAQDDAPLHQHLAKLSGQHSKRLLRGLNVAMIDEADSILLDEARVPLILSRNVPQEDQLTYHSKAMELATRLNLGQDFALHSQQFTVSLTPQGSQKIEDFCVNLSQLWHNRMHRENTICQALAAQYLYQKDQHYLVHQNKVHIIDEVTGRVASGRVWSQGLHQMIELKEGCKTSAETITLSQITYQRFFQRYLSVGGMSGTLHEARIELFKLYGLRVVKVPLRKPSQRVIMPTRLYPTQQQVWQHVISQIKVMQAQGRPVLIGTDSVEDSEQLSQQLHQAHINHQVLNARQDQQEASLVANAGKQNYVTVSTNMAGRGTDIHLDEATIQMGGLHVICCQHNVARRIDRQLIGRAARQGLPGSVETVLSTEKPVMHQYYPRLLLKLMPKHGLCKPQWLVKLIIQLPQKAAEAEQSAHRMHMMQQDLQQEQALSHKISGF